MLAAAHAARIAASFTKDERGGPIRELDQETQCAGFLLLTKHPDARGFGNRAPLRWPREHAIHDHRMALGENAGRALKKSFVDLFVHLRLVRAFGKPFRFPEPEILRACVAS
jgi:hypothetical protein